MAMPTGDKLLEKLRAWGLDGLYQVLEEAAANPASWPGTMVLDLPQPEQAEYIRNLIYAALWDLGVKPQFTVRLTPGRGLVVEQRQGAGQSIRIRTSDGSNLDPGQPARSGYRPEQGVMGDEGLIEMLTKPSKPDWMKSDEPAQADEPAAKPGFTLPKSAGPRLGHSNLLADQADSGQEETS